MIKSVKIGPIVYKVSEIEGLNRDGEKLDGQILYGECKICVKQKMNEQAKLQTMWHEILHGILTTAGITKEKESTIDALAYGIMQVLQDNPELRG